jgi:hypothetical protein
MVVAMVGIAIDGSIAIGKAGFVFFEVPEGFILGSMILSFVMKLLGVTILFFKDGLKVTIEED